MTEDEIKHRQHIGELRAELARVRIERETLAHGLRLANDQREVMEGRLLNLLCELDSAHRLRARLDTILIGTANALKGEPDPSMAHSWHDLVEWASAARAAADAAISSPPRLEEKLRHDEK